MTYKEKENKDLSFSNVDNVFTVRMYIYNRKMY